MLGTHKEAMAPLGVDAWVPNFHVVNAKAHDSADTGETVCLRMLRSQSLTKGYLGQIGVKNPWRTSFC